MAPDVDPSRGRFSVRGNTGLIVAVAVVVILLIMLPAYRWFFLISVAIGVAAWGILHWWHEHKPLKEEDVDHKKPLGL